MIDTYSTKPIQGEKRWVDFDEDTGLWCVFGLDSGFAYSSHADEDRTVAKMVADRKARA
jgi:hypothetical protein